MSGPHDAEVAVVEAGQLRLVEAFDNRQGGRVNEAHVGVGGNGRKVRGHALSPLYAVPPHGMRHGRCCLGATGASPCHES